VDYALTISSVSMPHITGGKMLPLAVSGPQRNPRLPNVPTITEAGLPVTLVSFGGLSVPAGTPAPIVRRLAETLDAVLAQPEVRRRLEANGGMVAPASSEAYTEALRAEIAQTEKMMKLAKLEAQ
jgi:tripartite-type tricarboxylate transporter receptor subunit TctC